MTDPNNFRFGAISITGKSHCSNISDVHDPRNFCSSSSGDRIRRSGQLAQLSYCSMTLRVDLFNESSLVPTESLMIYASHALN